MAREVNYYVNGKECTEGELIVMAKMKGWEYQDDDTAIRESIATSVIKFLVKIGMNVKSVYLCNPSNKEIKPPDVKQIPMVQIPLLVKEDVNPVSALITEKSNNAIMRIYYNDSIYMLNTLLMDNMVECWDVQAFGASACIVCADFNKPTCCGQDAIREGKNYLGNLIPVAVKIMERVERGDGK